MSRSNQKNESSDRLTIINIELHKVLCETIITLMKDTLKNPGITKEEIKAAKEFVELKPDTKAAQKLLEFLESEKVKEALIEEI
jgi:hypothetical protein